MIEQCEIYLANVKGLLQKKKKKKAIVKGLLCVCLLCKLNYKWVSGVCKCPSPLAKFPIKPRFMRKILFCRPITASKFLLKKKKKTMMIVILSPMNTLAYFEWNIFSE